MAEIADLKTLRPSKKAPIMTAGIQKPGPKTMPKLSSTPAAQPRIPSTPQVHGEDSCINEVLASSASTATVQPQPNLSPVGGSFTVPDQTSVPFNLEALLKRFRGKSAIVERVLGEFEEQAIRNLESLAVSLHANDGAKTASVAHALKGAAAILSAQIMQQLAGELEQMGHRCELNEGEACLALVKKEVERCRVYISAVRTGMAEAAAIGNPVVNH